jgi:hypothetical protein
MEVPSGVRINFDSKQAFYCNIIIIATTLGLCVYLPCLSAHSRESSSSSLPFLFLLAFSLSLV